MGRRETVLALFEYVEVKLAELCTDSW